MHRSSPASSIAAVTPRVFRTVAVVIAGLSFLLLIAALVVQLMSPGPGALALLVGEILAVSGALLSTVLLTRRPLAQAIAPVLVTLFMVIALYAVLFQPLTSLASTGLAIIMILVALTGSRRLTGLTAAAAAVTALLVGLLAPLLRLDFDTGPLMVPLLIAGPSIVLGLIWFATDRLLVARDEAIALAEGRAAEAETARAQAELARAEAEGRANEQARLLELVQSLELPVLSVGASVLAVPLIGNLDSRRLEAIRGAVLEAVSRQRAAVVIFDLTGLTLIDTAVAGGLLNTAQAVRLLGARPLLSGVRAPVAQTLANLGVDLAAFEAVGDLQEALEGLGSRRGPP